ncbi:MAG: DUF998 domain-containing protein [Desulfurococcales archaeon]|nr:DUF998 domain-containing protein [Desulfurococcales archaeon]
MEDLSDNREGSLADKAIYVLGLSSPILAWIFIFASWYKNPWFNVFRDAYSDLGGPDASDAWIYNYGLVTVGILLLAYSVLLTRRIPGKVGVIGGAYLALAGVFLSLIGVFHSGTRPHTFVSTWFFIQSDIAIILLSANYRRLLLGKILLIISVLAFPIAILVEATVGWPSTAILETYGILIIDFGVVATPFILGKETQYSRPSS